MKTWRTRLLLVGCMLVGLACVVAAQSGLQIAAKRSQPQGVVSRPLDPGDRN